MDEFVKALTEALKTEFAFMMGLGIDASDESWEKAARGMAEKMGVTTTSPNYGDTTLSLDPIWFNMKGSE